MLESRIEKMVGEFRAGASVPAAIQLWNGKRYDLGEHPTVTLRVPNASSLRCSNSVVNSSRSPLLAVFADFTLRA